MKWGRPVFPPAGASLWRPKKQFPKWGAADVGAEAAKVGSAAARMSLVKLFVPEYQRKCEMVTGKDPAEAAAVLGGKKFWR